LIVNELKQFKKITMKKAICMIALAAISFGSVFAAIPTLGNKTAVADTMKMKVKKKHGVVKKKKKMMKKDTTINKM
jgi:hypothetical protein